MKTTHEDSRTEQALIDAVCLHGDETAFRKLYRLHTPRLFQFVLRVLGGHENDAEDAVQETWVRACEGLDRYRGESAFNTWLTGIGLNVARDILRRQAAGHLIDWEELPVPPARTDAVEDRLDLEVAISRLPESYRMVVILHDIEGLKHHEIASLLSVAPGTCKSHLSRARDWLRTLLTPPREGYCD